MHDRGLIVSWTRVTWLGWLIGVPMIIVLSLIGEMLGIGGVQFIVGAGMGIGIGFMQARVMRKILEHPALWVWSSIVGLAAPFLVTDLAKAVGFNLPYSLPVAVTVAGLIVGIWQATILSSRVRQAGWWIAACALGWALAAGLASIADWLPRAYGIVGILGAAIYLGIVAAGGLVLGLVTGICLWWLMRHKAVT